VGSANLLYGSAAGSSWDASAPQHLRSNAKAAVIPVVHSNDAHEKVNVSKIPFGITW